MKVHHWWCAASERVAFFAHQCISASKWASSYSLGTFFCLDVFWLRNWLRDFSRDFFLGDDMDVSKNRGTPKWMVYNGKTIKVDDLGVPLFLETPIWISKNQEIFPTNPDRATGHRIAWPGKVLSEPRLNGLSLTLEGEARGSCWCVHWVLVLCMYGSLTGDMFAISISYIGYAL